MRTPAFAPRRNRCLHWTSAPKCADSWSLTSASRAKRSPARPRRHRARAYAKPKRAQSSACALPAPATLSQVAPRGSFVFRALGPWPGSLETAEPVARGSFGVRASGCQHGEPMDRRTAQRVFGEAEEAERRVLARSKSVSLLWVSTAEALERSADLADEHARRHRVAGRADDALVERDVAVRARAAASRASSHAENYTHTHCRSRFASWRHSPGQCTSRGRRRLGPDSWLWQWPAPRDRGGRL
jgi:hypothetical protein